MSSEITGSEANDISTELECTHVVASYLRLLLSLLVVVGCSGGGGGNPFIT